MEEDGCPPPAKQAKLSRYGFQADGNAGSALNEDGHATASDSGTRDQETDALESPEPRSSSSSSLLTDGGGASSRSSTESSTESAHELGKSS